MSALAVRETALRPFVVVPALGALAAVLVGLVIGGVSPLIGAGLVLVAVAGGAILVNDEAALLAVVLTVTLLPFAVVPVHIGLSPTFLDLLCLVLLVRWLGRRVHPLFPGAPTTPVDALVWLWLGVAVVALLAASGRTPLTADTLHYFVKVALATLVFFFVVDVARTRAKVQRLYAAFCGGSALAALIGLVLYFLRASAATRLLNLLGVLQYPTGPDVLRYRVDFNQAERAIATSVDPNVLGGLLMLALVLTLAQLAARKPFMARKLSAALTAPMLCCLLLTYSRSAWLGVLAASALLGVLRYRKLLVIGFVILLLFLQLPVSQRFTRQLISGLQAQDQAAAMRLGEASDALRLIGTYPAIGVGFGSAPDNNLYVGVSNIYLLMAEEMGLAGLALFGAIILVFFGWQLYTLPRILDPPSYETALALLAALFAALAAGMLDRYFFSYQSDIALLWFLFGLSAAAARVGRQPLPTPAAPRVIARPPLRVGALQPAGRGR